MRKDCPCDTTHDTIEQLKVMNETKDTILAIISHDLRGPVGSLMQISELIAEKNVVTESELYRLSDNQFHSAFGTNAEKGSGLGLKLCKSFIKLNGGELFIQSKLGEGSEFSFTIPKK